MRLAISNVSFRSNGISLVEDVTLNVASGGLAAVIGPNGAGKSTLVRVAAGDVPPTSGSVAYGDTPVVDLHVAQRALLRSVLTQQHSTDISFTVHQVVSMGRYPYRFEQTHEPVADQEAIESAITALDLEDLRHRQVRITLRWNPS